MDKKKLSIATITLARDEQEENLLRESLHYLAELDIPVFISDGGSNPAFLEFLSTFPHFKLVEAGKGVWSQAKKSIVAAYEAGSNFILYTEPDKRNFFKKTLSTFIRHADDGEYEGIILPCRSKTAFHTFPAFQQTTETTINYCCYEIIGGNFDYTYGPFIFNSKIAPYLKLVTQDLGWGWRSFTFNIANRLRYRVTGFEDDYTCPEDQQRDNRGERIHRMRQLSEHLQGLILSTSVKLELP